MTTLAHIENDEPTTWQELEIRVTRVLAEAAFLAERGKALDSARGSVNVDVYARDESINPPILTLFECKHWKRPVPQTVVHAFRTVVADTGANAGLIVSRSGFQSGANSATSFSNVKLVNWYEFQELYAERWYSNYMMRTGWTTLSPLIEYVEPINSRVLTKADALTPAELEKFRLLRRKYSSAMALVPVFFVLPKGFLAAQVPPTLPLRDNFRGVLDHEENFPDYVLDAPSLRNLLDAVIRYTEAACAEFDEVFGERA